MRVLIIRNLEFLHVFLQTTCFIYIYGWRSKTHIFFSYIRAFRYLYPNRIYLKRKDRKIWLPRKMQKLQSSYVHWLSFYVGASGEQTQIYASRSACQHAWRSMAPSSLPVQVRAINTANKFVAAIYLSLLKAIELEHNYYNCYTILDNSLVRNDFIL